MLCVISNKVILSCCTTARFSLIFRLHPLSSSFSSFSFIQRSRLMLWTNSALGWYQLPLSKLSGSLTNSYWLWEKILSDWSNILISHELGVIHICCIEGFHILLSLLSLVVDTMYSCSRSSKFIMQRRFRPHFGEVIFNFPFGFYVLLVGLRLKLVHAIYAYRTTLIWTRLFNHLHETSFDLVFFFEFLSQSWRLVYNRINFTLSGLKLGLRKLKLVLSRSC